MHHGIVAYFEAGGLGHTPMNLHTDRPRKREKKKSAADTRLYPLGTER